VGGWPAGTATSAIAGETGKIGQTARTPVTEVRGARPRPGQDLLAVEAPLEIRVVVGPEGSRSERSLSITMRTPGEDDELAAGFLFTEGLVAGREDIAGIRQPGQDAVVVELAPGVTLPVDRPERSFTMTSACGVCGRSSLEGLRATPAAALDAGAPQLLPEMVHRLPAALRAAQAAFASTGGIHAAGLFDAGAGLLLVREDVGRHNAVDKLIGARLLSGLPPARAAILLVSGRASFELVQKALMAQIPVLAAVGAPSSLAVSLATEAGMTLLGFVRDERFNVYSGGQRLGLGHG
jgi:FdhD protein